MTGQPRHFLNIDDFTYPELRGMLDAAVSLKARLKDGDRPQLLKDKVLAMIFDKQSTRTRVSFDVGMRQLGGETIMLSGQEMQLSREETLADTARVMCRYVDAIMIRILSHADLVELAEGATRAGDQRADAPRPSLPDHGRSDDLRGASRADQGRQGRLGRGQQQCAALLGQRRRTVRMRADHRRARTNTGPKRT